jgi:hypothetical protein
MHWSLRLQRPLFLFALFVSGAFPLAAAPEPASRAKMSELYGKLPLSFEANAGQVDRSVRFLSRGPGYVLFLTSTEAVLHLSDPQRAAAVVRMQMTGGNRHSRLSGESPLSARSNYFRGNDPRQWQIDVPSYARVRYESVYPGVDLVYHGNHRQLEYDFVLAPRADPRRIRLAFRGADAVTIGSQGELIVQTANGNLVQPPPEVYQETGGQRRRIDGRYVLLAPREVGFAVGRYDRGRPLVIDPVLEYSTYLGSGLWISLPPNPGPSNAIDAAGNTYIAGMTAATSFPGVGNGSIQPAFGGGTYDAFVTKINAAGTAIVYSTFLGGSGSDGAFHIAVDPQGNAYLVGSTTSPSFPGVSGSSIQPVNAGGSGGGDAFVTKINATGTGIAYSTFLGGGGTDVAFGIAVDATGNAYITGQTGSTTFPGVNGSSIQPALGGSVDGFVTKINPAGTAIVYSTFLGGEKAEQGNSIEVDSAGNAYVTGLTTSATFTGVDGHSIQPVPGENTNAFVTKINPSGTAIVYSTFLGGTGSCVPANPIGTEASSIAVDRVGSAYVIGYTDSITFPGVSGSSIQPANACGRLDAFVTKINAMGTAIVYSTFLGGSGADLGHSIAVDAAGNAYITGLTNSVTFPGVDGSSLQATNGSTNVYCGNAFVTKINPAGTATVYSTFLGGSTCDLGKGIAVDDAGTAYLVGGTGSTNFPGASASSIQPAFISTAGLYDAFVVKIGEPGLGFYTVAPCRLVDTRNAAGPLGGPALQAGAVRTFVVSGVCGIPSSARALSVNVTVTQSTAGAYLSLLPGDQTILPVASTINFAAGQTRSNNAIVQLAFDGSGGLNVYSLVGAHFILDVNGYFE